MAIVYRHRRLDTNDIFYIGIGKEEKRAFSKYKRNAHWINIVKKAGYQVEIISRDLTWEDACELEIFLIKLYGRKDLGLGKLVNMTDGGDGVNNPSKETRDKISKSNKGNTFNHTEETRRKIKEASMGRIFSTERKKKIGDANRGKKHSDKIIATRSKIIIQYDLDRNFINEYKSISEAGRVLGISISLICRVLKKRRMAKTAGGFIWEYKNNN